MNIEPKSSTIKAIIGLGNPGLQFTRTRHNIGFMVLDALAQQYNASWQKTDLLEHTSIILESRSILLIKPQTFMNASGKVIPWLAKKGITANQILVVHDELEKPFGSVSIKNGGSARGHNGLRSIIEACGPEFARLRVGIGRPAEKSDVHTYVLAQFNETQEIIHHIIEQAIDLIKKIILQSPTS